MTIKRKISKSGSPISDLEKEWSGIFEAADRKNLKISEKEVNDEIQVRRAAKRRMKG